MLINDFSQQDFLQNKSGSNKQMLLEIITAGTIFLAPILFLILISSS